ncbi:MAG: PAS domain S-box protein, partial [Deltaproteobacteria bacterium]|nr:PAS domain S-box protein [Deltaproteobacteria bacterium]
MKFATKLTLLFVGIGMAMTAVLFTIVYIHTSDMMEKTIRAGMESDAVDAMKNIDRFLYERGGDIQALASSPILRSESATPEEITEVLINYRNNYKVYTSLSFFNAERIRTADTAGLRIGLPSATTPYWDDIKEGKVSIASDVHISDEYQFPMFYFASPVRNRDQKRIGVVVARVATARLLEIIKENVKNEESEDIDLVNDKGLTLCSNNNRKGVLEEILPEWDYLKLIPKDVFSGIKEFTHLDANGNEIHAFARESGLYTFKGNGWMLLLQVPSKIVLAPVHQLLKIMSVLFLISIPLLVLLSIIFSRTVTRPLSRLAAAAHAIGEGQLDAAVFVSSKDEIGSLAADLNQMALDLKKVTVSKAYLDTIIDSMLEGLIVINAEGTIQMINREGVKFFGYEEAAQLIGKPILTIIPEKFQSGHTSGMDRYLKTGEKHILEKSVEVEGLRRDGTTFPLEIAIKDIGVEQERLFIAAFRDITDRKQNEEKLKSSEERHRTLFMSSRDALMTLGPPTWQFTSGNPATVAMFAAKDEADFTSHGPWEVSPEFQPDGRPSGDKAKEMIETAIRNGSHFFEWTHRRLSGEDFPATVLLTQMTLEGKTFLQATVRDITEQKKNEAMIKRQADELAESQTQLFQTAKLATLGEMSTGMAHEMNQPMAGISLAVTT